MTDVQPGVRERIDSPTSGNEVDLIVGVDGTTDEAVDRVEAEGGTVEERLPYDSLAVSIAETDLDALCSLDVVTSVEIEGKWEPMEAEEDFRSHPGSTR